MKIIGLALLIVAPQEELDDFIDRLDSPSLERRDAAEQALVALGRKAVPSLEKAAASDNLEVRARASAALKEILRRERHSALRQSLGADLLGEAPDLPRIATGESEIEWLKMIRDLSGYEVADLIDLGALLPGERIRCDTTRRDWIAILEAYAAGQWRNDRVEGTLYGVAIECRVELPGKLEEMKSAFEKRGGRTGWLICLRSSG